MNENINKLLTIDNSVERKKAIVFIIIIAFRVEKREKGKKL